MRLLLFFSTAVWLGGCQLFTTPTLEDPPPHAQRKFDKPIDDRTDEAKPPFVDLPHTSGGPGTTPSTSGPSVIPAPTSNVPSPSSTIAGSPSGSGNLGVDGNLSCEAYLQKYWKVGSETFEQADGPLMTKLNFTTRVLYVSGTQVTVSTKLATGRAEYDLDEQITFDACKEPEKSAIPKGYENCPIVEMGTENITVNGKTYKARKIQLGECKNSKGQTYQSTIWRVSDVPLWGPIKREVTGTVVPSIVNGQLLPTTKSWTFAP